MTGAVTSAEIEEERAQCRLLWLLLEEIAVTCVNVLLFNTRLQPIYIYIYNHMQQNVLQP